MWVLKSNRFFRFILTLCLILTPWHANGAPDPAMFYLAGNGGRDRCRTSECMCQVRPGPKPSNPETIEEIERRYSAYFPTAVHELTERQSENLSSYLERLHELSPSARATVMAYTDGCGTAEYNNGLARQRLQTAVEETREYFSIRSTLIHPEAPPVCPLQEARRIDIIVHTTRRITTAIDKIPADVYLIDASGSMWPEWRRWTDVINASYKPGSRIYVSMTTGCRTNQTLNSIRPQGGTEIWYAYYMLLDRMQPGETLAIISDFQSDIPLRAWERRLLDAKVAERGVNVIAVRL